jgi:hypothetical protein
LSVRCYGQKVAAETSIIPDARKMRIPGPHCIWLETESSLAYRKGIGFYLGILLPNNPNISLYCCSPHIIPGTYAEHPGGTLSKLPSRDMPLRHTPRNTRPPIAVHALLISLAWNTPGGPRGPLSPGIPFNMKARISP